jgi:hypothetical protein
MSSFIARGSALAGGAALLAFAIAFSPTFGRTVVRADEPTRPAPRLVSSTYLGDVRYDAGRAIAVDASGYLYVAGGRQQADNTDADAFVAKFDPTGSVLLWRTTIGGNQPDEASGVAVDAAGNVHITGWTSSAPSNPPGRPAFPTTPAARQPTYGGGPSDAFVAVLSPSGALVYSSFLGGSGEDAGTDIALDETGVATLTGWTRSADFPLMRPLQVSLAGGSDAYITRVSADKSALLYSTYLGGRSDDKAARLALDGAGQVHVAGATSSADFPTAWPLQATFAGGDADAFVAALDPGGASLIYSTYLGGSGHDEARDVALDISGHAYLTGTTDSPDFPTTEALQLALASPPLADAFVAKLRPHGAGLVYSTYLGSRGGHAIAVDASGGVFVTGDGVQVARLHASGTSFAYTFWGIGGSALALGSNGHAYVTGKTLSNLLPTLNAYQARNGGMFSSRGREDAFVTRISSTAAPPPAVEEDGPGVSYTGTWSESRLPEHSGGRAVRSAEPGARATFAFSGTGVQLVGYRRESSGALLVTLDSVPWGNVDTYASPTEAQALLVSITGLPPGAHTLSLEVASFKNARSHGNDVFIDGFTVLGGAPTATPTPTPTPEPTATPTPTPRPAPIVRIEENDRVSVRYSGKWYGNTSSIHSRRRANLAMNPGARATLTFTGTGVRWIGYRDEWSGRARVRLDGIAVAIIDTYSSPAQRQPVVFATSGLAPSLHTLTIEVLGDQNEASAGSWIWIDAFDVVIP